jgi:DEAD/DEAH box helicase domain-containing protein
MDFAALLDELKQSSRYKGQIVYYRCDPARPARYADLAAPLGEAGQRVLDGLGIQRLYTHQAAAVDAARAGQDVLLATGTASGKSLVYQLAILELLARDPDARVLALFPTKALAQDQMLGLQRLLALAGMADVLVGCYDGDTPSAMRRKLRDHGRVVITNPDMLHAGLMPQHTRWADLLEKLALVVVDEVHTYSGLFGANVANLFRRFDRLLRHYQGGTAGSGVRGPGGVTACGGPRTPDPGPRFVFCSATVGNPDELVRLLTDRRVTVVDDDGSPKGPRHWVFWNPPIIYGKRYRARRSANVEAHELMAELVRRGVPTITFSKAKITAELIYRYVTDNLRDSAPHLVDRVMPYRGGYLPEERREIEHKLFTGELLGVSCTRALELGIDVGGLEASIVVGYPGTLASFFQQAGRAGRREKESLVVLVGLDTSVNQYVMQHPEYVFGRPVEEGVVDRDNPYIIAGHVRCAAHELPVDAAEAVTFGPHTGEALHVLQDLRKVRETLGRWYHASRETPQFEMSLRGGAEAELVVQDRDSGKVIGHMNVYDAPTLVHPGAIYMHYGDTYLVDELDLVRRVAIVHAVDVDYYTQPHGGTDIHHIDRLLRRKPFGPGEACFGEVTAYFDTKLFERINFYRLEGFTLEPVSPPVPTLQLETMGLWLLPPEDLLREVVKAGLDPYAGLRAIGYGTRLILPLFVTCETLDFSHTVGCTNSPWQATFIYERYPLGLGFTERAYERLGEVLPAVLARIKECKCRYGCPCCVGKPLRPDATWNVERHEGSIPSKQAARLILEKLLADPARINLPDEDSLGQDAAEARLRLERSLRRRLERQGYPAVFHDIEPRPPEGFPAPESDEVLSDTDMARRAMRRKRFEQQRAEEAWQQAQSEQAIAREARDEAELEVSKRLGRLARGMPPAPVTAQAEPKEGAPESDPPETAGAPAPRLIGDAVAAAALRRKRRAREQE